MRKLRMMVVVGLALVAGFACNSQRKSFDGPTVDAFNGRVTVDGKPVSFPPGEDIVLRVYHHGSAQMFGIPIQPDGTFKIGWMPIGTYNSILARASKSAKGRGGNLYGVPGTFNVVEGQTEYVIELGKGYKP
jgi:hypothetical protein